MMHNNILLSVMKEDNGRNIQRFLLLLIVIVICLNCCSLYLFLRGFLPLKTVTTQYSTFDDVNNYSSVLHHDDQIYKPVVDRLVLIIIDALRADFVPSVKPGFFHQASLPFTESLIQSQKSLQFTTKCHAPTVTLPRIKSLLTGSIPSFADLIFNLNAGSLHQDNFLTQALSQNKKIVFYGDDTWIKLFPNHFFRQDGTTSFFVSDYTEVDRNVTRHIDKELELMDWDIMILHYLGIDHIGHLAGPVSSLLLPKLLEMDGIVEKIYKGLSSSKRKAHLADLVVITGDHGMSIGGNHGGVSLAEVLTPLIILSTNADQMLHMHSKEVFQIDIAATLSVLYGLPIPANNYGCVIKEVMNMTKTPLEHQLFNLYYNAMQLSQLVLTEYNTISDNHIIIDCLKDHRNWLSLKDTSTSGANNMAQQIMKKYTNYIERAREKLIALTEKYDTSSMITAIILSWQVVIFLFGYLILLSEGEKIAFYWTSFSNIELVMSLVLSTSILTYLYLSSNSLILKSLSTAIICSIMITYSNAMFIKSISILKHTSIIASIVLSQTNIFLVLGTALYVVSLLSSSFIEEEHQTWYFLTTSYYILLLYTLKISEKNRTALKCMCQVFSFKPAVENPSEQVLPVFTKCTTDYSEQEKCFEFYAAFKNSKFLAILGLIVLGRVLRSWNQTGNKWAHLPDIGDFLNLPEHKLLLTLTVVSAAIVIIILLAHEREALQSACLAICVLNIYFYRVSTKQLIFFMNIEELDGASTIKTFYIWLTVIVLLRICVYFYRTYKSPLDYTAVLDKFKLLIYFVQFWIIFAAVLQRPHNIPLLAGMILQENLVSKVLENKSIETLAIVYSWMAMCSFFYQGNSNSLSTIDVSAGYLGLSSYHPVVVGILIVCNTYSGILFWLQMLLLRIFQRVVVLKCECSVNEMEKLIRKCACTILCMRYLSFALYLVVMVILRYHLFIWTVFTPKLLYEGAHNIIFSLFVVFALLFSSGAKC